jgi:iron(III) transport system ATP-binding protein
VSEVKLSSVSKSFGATAALEDVDLTVSAGELTAVLGPSGCGKTTLLRIVAGFVRPDRGRVEIDGRPVVDESTNVPPERRGVAIVPQEGALFPHLDVSHNIGYGLPRSGNSRPRVEEMLELVGLGGLGGRRPDQLSGGQQQRVALARALAPSPRVIVFDEPFSALDAGLRTQVRDEVSQVLRDIGATAIIVTHDQEEALSMADSVAVMEQGRLVMHGSPAEVYHRPVDLSVARFVGDLVELPGTKSGDVVETVLGRLPIHGSAAMADGPVVAAVRPEQIRVDAREDREAHGAHVDAVSFFGHDALARLTVSSGGTAVAVTARTVAPLRRGDVVAIRVIGPALVYPA